MRHGVLVALVIACLAGPAAAQTAAEDEARIEELIARERRSASPGPVSTDTPDTVDASIDAAPVEPEADASLVATRRVEADPGAVAIPADDMPRNPNEVAYADLGRYVGRHVRVMSVGGRARVGRVDAVDASGVAMTVRTGGGYASFRMPATQISRIERLEATR